MQEGDKGLERKEMRVQKKQKVDKFPAEKEIAMAKKWRSESILRIRTAAIYSQSAPLRLFAPRHFRKRARKSFHCFRHRLTVHKLPLPATEDESRFAEDF